MAGGPKPPGALSASDPWLTTRRLVLRLQTSIAKAGRAVIAPAGSRIRGSWKGLSRMTGNCHVRFLGEPGRATAPGLPGGALVRNYQIERHGGAVSANGIGAYGVAWWVRPPLRHYRLLRPTLVSNEKMPRLARGKASAPACREEERGSAEVLLVHLGMNRPIGVAERRIAAAVDGLSAAAVGVTDKPASEGRAGGGLAIREGRAEEIVDSRSSCERGNGERTGERGQSP